MKKKIYLTYKQIETLCFSKIVFISDAQLDISRSKKYYEFAIFIDENNIIIEKEKVVLLFSSILEVEIPKSEFNLFKNQFKLPLGLLSLADRSKPKYPDSSENQANLPLESPSPTGENELKDPGVSSPVSDSQIIKLYSRIRRSLTQLVLFGYKKNNSEIHTNLSGFFNKITNLSTFEITLIKKINEEGCFPKKNTKEIKPEEFYKYVWWGKFIIDMILVPQKDHISDEEYGEHRSWFKRIDSTNLSNNSKCFESIPRLFIEHSGAILGYFIGSLSISNINEKNTDYEIDSLLIKTSGINYKYDILFWGIFFQAFFAEELDYSFPNPIIQDDFFKMEDLSYAIVKKLLNNNEDKIESDFTFKAIDYDNLVISLERLKEKSIKIPPTIVDESQLKKPFEESLLFGNNKEKIGFINERIGKASYLGIDEKGFELRSKCTTPPIVFYGELSEEEKERLKKSGVNIKIKDISTLISKEKKVLMAFYSSYKPDDPLFNIYKNIIKRKKTRVEKFIFIWLVSKDNKTLHSPEFAFEKDNLKKVIESEFGLKTIIIVKNIYNENTGDIEVIRNIKLALKNYRFKNVEVIDCNFKEEHAGWIIATINDYIVKSKNIDYFSFSN